ncbi:unnamed protein product [Orchesella dallaii]|uniref:Uncharacterized protein n=1 Tax=Orchesella dallaii TaxID=48710 RepID=A0ABP1RDR4_9HEXA
MLAVDRRGCNGQKEPEDLGLRTATKVHSHGTRVPNFNDVYNENEKSGWLLAVWNWWRVLCLPVPGMNWKA